MQLRPHGFANVLEYSNSELFSKTKEVLEAEVNQLKRQEEEAAAIVWLTGWVTAKPKNENQYQQQFAKLHLASVIHD